MSRRFLVEGSTDGAADIVTDQLLGGRLTLRQPRTGHKAGTDALLLAAAAPLQAGERFIDVGCGVGTVGLALALRAPEACGRLLDDDDAAIGLARENCRLNHCSDRVGVACADLFDAAACRAAGLAPEAATLVVTNPPYFREDAMRMSCNPGRARAHALGRDPRTGQLRDHAGWLRAALSLLAPKGVLCAIHRPDALPQLLAACDHRLGSIVIRPVHARRQSAAIRILLTGRKGSKATLSIAPPFVLHDGDGRFTPEAEAVNRGEPLMIV
jgi:tRNA1(Val) A37 N6-methylase TrmN6